MMKLKNILKDLLPPVTVKVLKRLLGKTNTEYCGNYPDWASVVRAAGSYDDKEIFERVKEARMKVLRGEAIYERDSKTFGEIQYSWPVLACLLVVANKSGNNLHVLDFGGSLGSSYFQNKEMLEGVNLRWNIIEQKHFVEFGKENIKDVHFYEDIESCLKETKPNAILISSVLQYISEPMKTIESLKKVGANYIILDRTTVTDTNKTTITVQNVPKKIYPVNFPAWIFNEKELIASFAPEYRLVHKFTSIGDRITTDKGEARNLGYFLERN